MADETKCDDKCSKSIGILVLRLFFLFFMLHGIQKLMGLDGTSAFFGKLGIPIPALMALLVALLETFGSLAIVLGIGTEYVAPLIVADMAVAIILAKMGSVISKGFPFGLGQMELEMSYLLVALAIYLLGPGSYSVAAMLKKKSDK